MTIQPIDPDSAIGAPSAVPSVTQTPPDANGDAGLFSSVLDGIKNASSALETAQQSETAFANGSGNLQEMVFERARADSLLSIASSAASKATQALNTIINMQV